MDKFKNILFVSDSVADDKNSLKQAIAFASNNEAKLDILILYPKFPKNILHYKQEYEDFVIEEGNKTIKKTQEELNSSNNKTPIRIKACSTNLFHINIINHVQNNNYHLIIKQAEGNDQDNIFKALDMKLLRLAPCPVWLCRPVNHGYNHLKVAVAIDAESQDRTDNELSVRLLRTSMLLANEYNCNLDIISCFDVRFKYFLDNNVWINRIPEDELKAIFDEHDEDHENKMNQLIKNANITKNHTVYYCKGEPETEIPEFVAKEKIDILVMGSIGRSGISGYFIGNTAENIIQKINCSLLTIKPKGFITPVETT